MHTFPTEAGIPGLNPNHYRKTIIRKLSQERERAESDAHLAVAHRRLFNAAETMLQAIGVVRFKIYQSDY